MPHVVPHRKVRGRHLWRPYGIKPPHHPPRPTCREVSEGGSASDFQSDPTTCASGPQGFASAKPSLQISRPDVFGVFVPLFVYRTNTPKTQAKSVRGWQEAKILSGFSVCRRQTATARIKDSRRGTWRGSLLPRHKRHSPNVTVTVIPGATRASLARSMRTS